MLTVLLYHTGSQLTEGFKKLYQEKIAETDSADFAATLPNAFCEKYENQIIDFGHVNEEISEVEIIDAILLKNSNIQDGDGDLINGGWTFRNANRTEQMSCLKIAERLDEMPADGIYAPYVCKTFFGFELGDTLNISFGNKQESFTIAGFTEDVLLAAGHILLLIYRKFNFIL